MRSILFLFLTLATLQAGVVDFKTLSDAKQAYKSEDYAKAAELYGKVETKNDAARYNYGDALYKQKKYKEALAAFGRVSDPDLKAKALHNTGNCYANLGKTDEAIKAYESALKLHEDEDTRYNLEQLKRQKKQQQKRQDKDQQQKKNTKDQKNGQNQKNQQDQNAKEGKKSRNDQKQNQKQNQKNNEERKKQEQKNNDQDKKDRERKDQRKSRSDAQKEKNDERQKEQQRDAQKQEKERKENEQKNASRPVATKQQPINDMEERKYNQMLDKRGIKTLMIPLQSKGEPHESETTPW